ncbi:hypothetical protein LOTGIDRAFT_171172 [Lottia gigantea]|uniref:Uncharacterized protein n=1 Tax=Lottia gigantea TaxID=225164 RepID=V4BC99_LOTGI|nr:hypothetical protein LOTGIDRAFT_171172 [Lottia gigantea]ESP03747.1 hypothetical protein LOTGIDRAFT_171172 [Lottia gigantea]
MTITRQVVGVILIGLILGTLSQERYNVPDSNNNQNIKPAVKAKIIPSENGNAAVIRPVNDVVHRGDNNQNIISNQGQGQAVVQGQQPKVDQSFNNGVIRNVNNQQAAPVLNVGNNNDNNVVQFNNPVNNNNNNNNFQQQQNFQNKKSQREIGGMKLNWDWSDFAISFNDYGAAEQKVRRAPHASTGEPWPLPQYYVKKSKKVYRISASEFTFKIVDKSCDILESAAERYRDHVLNDVVEDMYDNLQHADGTVLEDPASKYDSPKFTNAPVITVMELKVRKPCSKYPGLHSDESCNLS